MNQNSFTLIQFSPVLRFEIGYGGVARHLLRLDCAGLCGLKLQNFSTNSDTTWFGQKDPHWFTTLLHQHFNTRKCCSFHMFWRTVKPRDCREAEKVGEF